MSTRAGTRLAAVLCVLAALLSVPGTAAALPNPQLPPDVAAVFSGPAVRQAQALDDGESTDFSGDVRADDIHEVFAFSPDFIDGLPTDEPVVSTGEWLAAMKRGNDVLGTVGVGKPAGGPAEPTGFSNDVAIGSALGTVAVTEILVADEPNRAYYAIAGSTVRPLNDGARKGLPEPGTVADVQDIVAAQYALARAQPTDSGVPRMLPLALSAVAVALLVAGIVLLRRRNRYGTLEP